MNINITVLVQMINFGIAYLVLRYFLFTPAIECVEQKNVEKNSILSMIEQLRQSLDIQKKARQQQWHECQEYFKQHRPVDAKNQPIIVKKNISSIVSQQKMETEITHCIATISSHLEEKIKHVWL
jgi:F0F1-type ATP synthase membrane subunit b/b'